MVTISKRTFERIKRLVLKGYSANQIVKKVKKRRQDVLDVVRKIKGLPKRKTGKRLKLDKKYVKDIKKVIKNYYEDGYDLNAIRKSVKERFKNKTYITHRHIDEIIKKMSRTSKRRRKEALRYRRKHLSKEERIVANIDLVESARHEVLPPEIET